MKKILNSKGMTMVNVIIAFAILMSGSVIFYKSMQISLNMIEKADSERVSVEKSIESYYNNRNNSGGTVEDKTLSFKVKDGGNSAFEIKTKLVKNLANVDFEFFKD